VNEKSTDKIKLILKGADTEEILRARNNKGKTPLQYAMQMNASNEILDLLRPGQTSTTVLDDKKVKTEPNTRHTPQVVTSSIQCTTSPTTPPSEDTNASQEIIRRLNEQLKEANDCASQIQRDFDEKCGDIVNLQNTLQVERAEKQQLTSSLVQKGKENEKLQQQKENIVENYAALNRHAYNLTKLCSEQKDKLQEMGIVANATGERKKRKRDNEEHAFIIMEQLQLEKEQHGKLMKQFLEIRREQNAQLEHNTSTETAASTAAAGVNLANTQP
jgi:hypothetical protein